MLKIIGPIVAVLAALALALGASPASAATHHEADKYLHFPARAADAVYMRDRVLNLHGTYYWHAFSAHWAHRKNPAETSRTVRLHGRYVWSDYLVRAGKRYRHVSTFRNATTGGIVYLKHIEPGRAGDGSYHWGSTIVNTRSGTTTPN
jgi:hypothetical protein